MPRRAIGIIARCRVAAAAKNDAIFAPVIAADLDALAIAAVVRNANFVAAAAAILFLPGMRRRRYLRFPRRSTPVLEVIAPRALISR